MKGTFKGEDIVTIGKYKGKTISWILSHDHSYVRWMVDTINGFKLDDITENRLDTIEEGASNPWEEEAYRDMIGY